MHDHDSVQALTRLGFTGLEAEVYVFLLQASPMTGYKVAQGTGKTNANAYKTLESLRTKGAVLLEEGEPRIWRAVPPDEVLAQLRRGFDQARQQAEDALARLQPATADHRVYQLTSRAQIFERARSMLERCRWIAVLDLYPAMVRQLRESLVAAAARGPRVTLKTYGPIDTIGDLGQATVIERQNGHEITSAAPFDNLAMVVDGEQYLTATFEPASGNGDGAPVQAIWTASPVLAYEAYHSLIYGLILTDLQQAVWDGENNAALVERLARHEYLHPIRGKSPVHRHFLKALGVTPAVYSDP